MNNMNEVFQYLLNEELLEDFTTGDLYRLDNDLMMLTYDSWKIIESEGGDILSDMYTGFWKLTQVIPKPNHLRLYGVTIRGEYKGYSYAITREAIRDLGLTYGINAVESIRNGVDLYVAGDDTTWVIEKEGYRLTCNLIIEGTDVRLIVYKNVVDNVE